MQISFFQVRIFEPPEGEVLGIHFLSVHPFICTTVRTSLTNCENLCVVFFLKFGRVSKI